MRIKKLIITVCILALSAPVFSYFRLSLSPGLEPYGDALGYNVAATLTADLRSLNPKVGPGLFTGLDLSFSSAAYSNLTFYNVNGGLVLGYRLEAVKSFLNISPGMTLGAGYYSFADRLTNVGRAGFLVKPAVQVELMIVPQFSLSLEAAARFVFMPLLVEFYSPTAYVFSLVLSYYIRPDGK